MHLIDLTHEEERVAVLHSTTPEQNKRKSSSRARCVARDPGTYRYRWDLGHVGPLGRCPRA
jgi:hypothetical protein